MPYLDRITIKGFDPFDEDSEGSDEFVITIFIIYVMFVILGHL